MKKTLVCLIATVLFISCGDKKKAHTNAVKNDTTKSETKEQKQNWSYQEDKDQMTGEKRYFALCNSTNTESFKFPYEGGSSFILQVRNMSGENEVLISVSKGQFTSNVMENKSLRVKFDEDKPIQVGYTGTSDASSDIIFLTKPATFLKKLSTAKKVAIEAEFFQEGYRIMNFDVDGLKWSH